MAAAAAAAADDKDQSLARQEQALLSDKAAALEHLETSLTSAAAADKVGWCRLTQSNLR
jgi:hypothetical protein